MVYVDALQLAAAGRSRRGPAAGACRIDGGKRPVVRPLFTTNRPVYNTGSTPYGRAASVHGIGGAGAERGGTGRSAVRPSAHLEARLVSACIISTRDARGRSYQRGRLVGPDWGRVYNPT